MNYTENYQLPQWEENDRVLMADFNAMTQKIDGAIAFANRVETLAEIQVASAVTQIDLETAGKDLTKYQEILLHISVPTSTIALKILTNNIVDNIYHVSEGFVNRDLENCASNCLMWVPVNNQLRLAFYPPKQGELIALVKEQIRCSSSQFIISRETGVAPVKWEELLSLNFCTESDFIPAGSCFSLKGIKR